MFKERMTAKDVLDAHWDGALPVRPIAIARSMGIEVFKSSTLGHSGQIQLGKDDETPVIVFNDTEALVRQRFTVAHEIGHFALGHLNDSKRMFRDESKNFSAFQYDTREVEANQFAAAFLMPGDIVRLAVQQGTRSISALAEMFRVSEAAMKFRLINLGMLSG